MRTRTLFLAVAALLGMTAVSCNKATITEEGISVSTNSLSFDAAGGERTISIVAKEAWTVETEAGWLTITPSSNGRTVNIAAKSNFAPEGSRSSERKTEVVITAGLLEAKVSVIQSAESIVFDLDTVKDTVEVAPTGGPLSIKVVRNISSYEVNIPAEATWIRRESSKSTLTENVTFIVDENTGDPRMTQISFVSSEAGTRAVIIKQNSALEDILEADPLSYTFGKNGGGCNISVTTNYSWSASCDAKWLSLVPSNQTGLLKVTAQKNVGADGSKAVERRAEIEIFTGTKRVVVSIKQEGDNKPADAINGLYSISADKQVYFSKGNLRYDVSKSTWGFCENQYDYQKAYSPNEIMLFTWGYGEWSSDPQTGTSSNVSAFVDWGTVIGEPGTWSTLTYEEMYYLLEARGTGDTYKKCGVTVCGSPNCIVLAPDGNTVPIESSYDTAAWSDAEAAGFVCLPCGGYRAASSLDFSYGGYYWTSSVKAAAGGHIWSMNIKGSQYSFSGSTGNWGYSVRLVSGK